MAAEQGRELGDGVAPRPRGGRVGGDAAGSDADDVAVPIELEPAGLGRRRVPLERGRQPVVGAGDDRLGGTRHLREIAAAGERRQAGRPSGAPRAVAQGAADRAGAELAGDDGVQGVERDVERRRRPAGEELAERGPVGLLGERDDELDAAAPGQALVAERLQAVERGGDGPLVVLHSPPQQPPRLGVAVEGERIGLPGRGVGGPHVGVRQDAEAVGRPAEPHHQGRPVVLEVEPQPGRGGGEVALEAQELGVAGVGHPVLDDGAERDEIGQGVDDGVEVRRHGAVGGGARERRRRGVRGRGRRVDHGRRTHGHARGGKPREASRTLIQRSRQRRSGPRHARAASPGRTEIMCRTAPTEAVRGAPAGSERGLWSRILRCRR